MWISSPKFGPDREGEKSIAMQVSVKQRKCWDTILIITLLEEKKQFSGIGRIYDE